MWYENMKSGHPHIAVERVTKAYPLHRPAMSRLRAAVLGKAREAATFHALEDISFSVNPGDVLGIVGRNGSGKSTLLKIISGVVRPSTGAVEASGRISSLLELGGGFNPELSGYDNILFFGATQGIRPREMERRAQDIVAFADIGAFIDQPVKTYSSGMFVRLAYACAINVDPDILIVDEALSVGDALFQKKCMDHLHGFMRSDKIVLFVSHDIYTVKSLCNRAILLDGGRIKLDSNPDEVAGAYHSLLFPQMERAVETADEEASPAQPDEQDALIIRPSDASSQWGRGGIIVERVMVEGLDASGALVCPGRLTVAISYRWKNETLAETARLEEVDPHLLFGLRLEDALGRAITDFATGILSPAPTLPLQHGEGECVFSLDLPALSRGAYFLTPEMAIGSQRKLVPLKEYPNLIHFEAVPKVPVLGMLRLPYEVTCKSSSKE
jgi:ABC-type polysaccharide/polyol phosphate transport system ATPase subunit